MLLDKVFETIVADECSVKHKTRYSGSKNCPNVCTFWKDWHGVKQ